MPYTAYTRNRQWPFSSSSGFTNLSGSVQFFSEQAGYKTSKPSKLVPLAYTLRLGGCNKPRAVKPSPSASWSPRSMKGGDNSHPEGRCINDYYGIRARAQNRARSNLIDALHSEESAQLGAAAAEWNSSFQMIADRAQTLINSYRRLRKGDVRGAAKALKLPQREAKTASKSLKRGADTGSVWLEWWFGWSPLIDDIHSAVKVLEQQFPYNRVMGSGRGHHIASNEVLRSTSTFHETFSGRIDARVGIHAKVRLANPNLAKASQLGLINPATVAWEVIPFSFLVDWFVPVSDFLESFSDTVGWDLKDVIVSSKTGGTGWSWTIKALSYANAWHYYEDVYATYFTRTVGTALPPYLLRPNKLNGLSLTRAATSVALLLQVLRGG